MTTPNIEDADLLGLERGRTSSVHSETWPPTETTPDAFPPHANVLEPIETGDTLRDRPTVLLCPGCGTDLKEYPTGLPAYVSHFRVACPDCEITLKRWAVVAIDVAYAGVSTPNTLARAVQRYWERHLWAGIQTSGEYARTEEFTEAYQRLASRLDWDWELTCPLCRRPMSELGTNRLEYHHWTRGRDDRGICLCRACHLAISDNAYDAELDWQARELASGAKTTSRSHGWRSARPVTCRPRTTPASLIDSSLGTTCPMRRKLSGVSSSRCSTTRNSERLCRIRRSPWEDPPMGEHLFARGPPQYRTWLGRHSDAQSTGKSGKVRSRDGGGR